MGEHLKALFISHRAGGVFFFFWEFLLTQERAHKRNGRRFFYVRIGSARRSIRSFYLHTLIALKSSPTIALILSWLFWSSRARRFHFRRMLLRMREGGRGVRDVDVASCGVPADIISWPLQTVARSSPNSSQENSPQLVAGNPTRCMSEIV